MRFARMVLLAMVFAACAGQALAQAAPARRARVVSPSHLEIMSSGHFVGKVSLAVGTQVDVDGVDGEYLLVHIHQVHGRVPAKDTDIDGPLAPSAPAPAAAARAAVPASAKAPAPGAGTAPAATLRPTPTPTTGPAQAYARDRRGATMAVIMFDCAMLLATVILFAGYWRLFTKAGKPGWAILVPVYNMVVMQQVAGKPLWWILLFFVPLVNFVVFALLFIAIAESFGRGKAYGLGMFLLPWIFVPILAFGDAVYVGGPDWSWGPAAGEPHGPRGLATAGAESV